MPVALLGIATANAQIKFGAKAGVNLSTFTNTEDAKMKFGFHAGGFAEFMISNRISIQPELLYSTQGAIYSYSYSYLDENEEDDIINVDVDETINLDYINLPVLLKVKLIEGLSLEVGPQIGFLLSAKNKLEEKENGVKVLSETEDIKDQYKTFDVTAVLGLSYTFAEKFIAGVRYNFGLTTVIKQAEENHNPKNGIIQISLGYKF
ncbi:MAG: PorT family protein [Prevotellaceae bacterium]|jgi:opacity protein-like surface antigen|nr:PorT family protein [Prevotellaceae bacterium]